MSASADHSWVSLQRLVVSLQRFIIITLRSLGVNVMGYRFCEAFIFVFFALALTHTVLLNQLGGPVLKTPDAIFLSQTLMDYRSVMMLGLGSLYIFFRVTGRNVSPMLVIGATLAWLTFLEDTFALDNVLFVPELITGKATQFSRPFFLVAITYMAVESRRVVLSD